MSLSLDGRYPELSLDRLQDALLEHLYVSDRGLLMSLFLALRLGKPLLLEGEAGTGKTEVAKVLAEALGARLIRLQCYEGLDVSAAVYEWNYARQMLEIRLLEARGAAEEEGLRDVFGPDFLIERPLLQAIAHRDPVPPVLLIDELDRADAEFEAFLLELLSDFQVSIPELGTISAAQPPVVVLTSNRTREIHDALKRRCLYHWIDYPTLEKERRIVALKVPEASERLAAQVCRMVQMLRGMELYKPPGVSETLDWARALDAARALTLVDLSCRDDVYAALRAVLLDTHTHEPVFAAAFERFWSGLAPLIEEQAAAPLGYAPAQGPRPRGEGGEDRHATAERMLLLAGDDDLMDEGDPGMADASEGQAVAYSATEALRRKDFAHLTPRELAEMRRLLADLAFTPPLRRLRRSEAARGGPLLDLRRVARRNLRYGGEVLVLPRRRRKQRTRPLALLCDVSGSMDRYTRLLLRFLHATTQGLTGVETFVFGTRLTRITHQLRLRDPDRALDEV